MKYLDIQKEVIEKYNVKIVYNSKCWSRTHAHCDGTRRVCKWNAANSIATTFILFHEIGHLETYKTKMRRCESEFAATQWAIDKFKEYKLKLPEKTIQMHQEYVFRELDRGLRRGGKNYPSKEELTFKI